MAAQAIAAAIPLAVLAMLEGLKGDAGEVTRLAAQASLPSTRGIQTDTLGSNTGVAADTTVRRADTPGWLDGSPWTARTLAQGANCGRSSAAAFLRLRREQTKQAASSWCARAALLRLAGMRGRTCRL